jgi:hypothetical protein
MHPPKIQGSTCSMRLLNSRAIRESVVCDRKAPGGKFAFFRRVLRYAWRGSKPDWVICGHLNLLPAAWLLAWLRGARLALIIHGIEAWKQRSWLYGLMLKFVDSFISEGTILHPAQLRRLEFVCS